MSRSSKKGPWVEERLMSRIEAMNAANQRTMVKTWSRASTIFPEMVGHTIAVHDGRKHVPVFVSEARARVGERGDGRPQARRVRPDAHVPRTRRHRQAPMSTPEDQKGTPEEPTEVEATEEAGVPQAEGTAADVTGVGKDAAAAAMQEGTSEPLAAAGADDPAAEDADGDDATAEEPVAEGDESDADETEADEA